MLRDRVSPNARLAGCRFLFFSLILFSSGIPVHSLFGPIHQECVADQLVPAGPASHSELPISSKVAAPPTEASDFFNAATDQQLDSVIGGTSLCSTATVPSSRIIPRGLVLSYLCDSARHQCSGVQLI